MPTTFTTFTTFATMVNDYPARRSATFTTMPSDYDRAAVLDHEGGGFSSISQRSGTLPGQESPGAAGGSRPDPRGGWCWWVRLLVLISL